MCLFNHSIYICYIYIHSISNFSADTRLQERRDALCIVSFDGNISWIPQGIYMSTCSIDVTTFPFDKQKCPMKFGSWAYGGSRINLNFLDGDSKMLTDDYFVPNKAWIVLEAPGQRNVIRYACCAEKFEDLTYTLIFRRSATNYVYILILPCVLLTTLTLVLYWIPPESPTKMSLGTYYYFNIYFPIMTYNINTWKLNNKDRFIHTGTMSKFVVLLFVIFVRLFPHILFMQARL